MHREVAYRASLLRLPGFLLASLWTGWKRAKVAVTQALLFRRIRGDEKRVAVYRIGSIGDLVHALPALSAIRRRHADAAITLVTNSVGGESWPERLGLSEALDLSVTNYGSATELRQAVRGAECLYYLAPHPLGLWRALRDALFFRSCGLRRASGFRALTPSGWITRALRPRREAEPQYQRLLRACGLADGARVELPRTEFADGPAKPYVVLAPVGKSQAQRWAPDRYVEIARRLQAAGRTPVWVGAPDDGARMGPLVGATRFGSYDFTELAALFGGAAAVIGNDSGLLHLAAYVGAPVVVISTARAAAYAWRPPGARVVVLRKDMNCEACHLRECSDVACLHLISVDEAWVAIEPLISASAV